MKFFKVTLSLALLLGLQNAMAQDDLMKELDDKGTQKEVVSAAFKGVQIAQMQSTKMPAQNEWYFVVSHRFGDLNNGINNFFGLDGAQTKIGGIYGITSGLAIQASRSSNNEKTYELGVKYRIANQRVDGFPVTIVGFNTTNIDSYKINEFYPKATFTNRVSFASEILISRKFGERFSAQLTPTYIHRNLYDALREQENLFLIGAGARLKVSKRISLTADYSGRVSLPDEFNSPYRNPFTFGMDIDTGGHIFQLVFSNTQNMDDVNYYSRAGETKKGLYFGFNLYRVF